MFSLDVDVVISRVRVGNLKGGMFDIPAHNAAGTLSDGYLQDVFAKGQTSNAKSFPGCDPL